MIKCFGFGKLLKQLFIISLISCFGLLGSSFVNAGTVQSVGLDKYNSEYNSAFKVGFIKGGGVLTEYLGTTKSVLALNSDVLFWWAENGQPYFYAPGFQGFFGSFYTCDVLTGTDSPIANHCQATTLTDDYKSIFKSFFSKVKQGDFVGYDYYYLNTSSGNGYNRQKRIQVCFSSEEIGSSMCFRYSSCQVSSNLSFCDSRNYGSLVNSQNLSNLTFANIPYSYISYAPGQAGYDGSDVSYGDNQVIHTDILDDVNYTDLDGSNLIDYFENNPFYKFNKNVCYVGVNDLTGLLLNKYYSGLTYSPGSGKTVFEFFSSLYGNTFSITQLGSFIDVYRANYATIFILPEDERLYRMTYNFGGNVSLDYDNLTIDRFLNLPIPYYTMGRITYSFGQQQSIGEEIATYCYQKLNLNTDSGNLNITDDHGEFIDNNAGNFISNWNRYSYNSGGINIVSQSWEGTPLDYFTGEDNLDFNTFFNKSFNKFKNVFVISNQDLGAGFLPTYIILFLVAIILFRFLAH